MADDTAIRKALMEAAKWRKQTLNYHLNKWEPYMSRSDALYMLAKSHAVRLDRFGVDDETQSRAGRHIREYLEGDRPRRAATPSPETTSKQKDVPDVGFALPRPDLSKPLLGVSLQRSGQAYALLFVLENSIRAVLKQVLGRAAQSGDWTDLVKPELVNAAEVRRAQDGEHPWAHGRGDDLILYMGFGEYEATIKRNWKHFKPIFDRQSLVEESFKSANLIRRAIAHTAPIKKSDYEVFTVEARKLMALIKDREDRLPE